MNCFFFFFLVLSRFFSFSFFPHVVRFDVFFLSHYHDKQRLNPIQRLNLRLPQVLEKVRHFLINPPKQVHFLLKKYGFCSTFQAIITVTFEVFWFFCKTFPLSGLKP